MACLVNIWVHLKRMCLLCSLDVVFDICQVDEVVDSVVQMVLILTLYVVAVLIAKRGC